MSTQPGGYDGFAMKSTEMGARVGEQPTN